MTIELNVATIIYIATCIVTVGGAVKILLEARKALQKPIDEVNRKLEHYDRCLDKDKRHLDKLDTMVVENAKAINMMVDANLTMLRHMSDGNHTGELKEKITKLEDWLYKGKEYTL